MLSHLATLGLCHGMNADEEAQIEGLCEEVRFEGGEPLIEEGKPDRGLFVITSGKVKVVKTDAKGQARTLAEVGPETVLGELSLALHTPRTATATAEGAVEAVRLDAVRFDALLEANALAAFKLAHNLLKVVAERHVHLNEKLLEFMGRLDEGGGVHSHGLSDQVSEMDRIIAEWGC